MLPNITAFRPPSLRCNARTTLSLAPLDGPAGGGTQLTPPLAGAIAKRLEMSQKASLSARQNDKCANLGTQTALFASLSAHGRRFGAHVGTQNGACRSGPVAKHRIRWRRRPVRGRRSNRRRLRGRRTGAPGSLAPPAWCRRRRHESSRPGARSGSPHRPAIRRA